MSIIVCKIEHIHQFLNRTFRKRIANAPVSHEENIYF